MKRIYSVILPEATSSSQSDEITAALSELGTLNGGTSVEQLSSNPGEFTLEGRYAYGPTLSQLLATELEELSDAQFGSVPLVQVDSESNIEGYYEVQDASTDPAHPNARETIHWDITLKQDGTHETRWSAVETNRWTADHPYGNDLEPFVAIPSAASKQRWYNPESGALAGATATGTVTADHGDLDRYSLDDGETAVGTESSTLLYELSYADCGVVDPVVWDAPAGAAYGEEYGTDYGGVASKLSSDGVRQWQHVFSTSHEYTGTPVLDTGRLRVFAFESDGRLEAQEWDPATSEWSSVALDWSGDWAVFDVDVETITPAQLAGQFTFLDESDGSLFALDGFLDRGADRVRWHIPDGETGPIPSGLKATLEPIASSTLAASQPERALIRRAEVRR